jgi:hypothetical protein
MCETKISFTIFVVWCMVNLLFFGCSRGKPQSGSQSESQPASQSQLKKNAPKVVAQIDINTPADNDELKGIEHLVRGKVTDYSKGNVFVLVHPLRTHFFWVQRPPSLINPDGSWQTICFLGTKTQGIDGLFELIAIITKKTFKAGDTLAALPTDAIKSPFITVKRIE